MEQVGDVDASAELLRVQPNVQQKQKKFEWLAEYKGEYYAKNAKKYFNTWRKAK